MTFAIDESDNVIKAARRCLAIFMQGKKITSKAPGAEWLSHTRRPSVDDARVENLYLHRLGTSFIINIESGQKNLPAFQATIDELNRHFYLQADYSIGSTSFFINRNSLSLVTIQPKIEKPERVIKPVVLSYIPRSHLPQESKETLFVGLKETRMAIPADYVRMPDVARSVQMPKTTMGGMLLPRIIKALAIAIEKLGELPQAEIAICLKAHSISDKNNIRMLSPELADIARDYYIKAQQFHPQTLAVSMADEARIIIDAYKNRKAQIFPQGLPTSGIVL